MTNSEWIMVAQTVVMFLTGVIVWWYTVETKRLRETSSKQLDVLQNQLAVAKEALQKEHDELLRQSRPFLRWGGGSSGADNWEREFFNEGAPVTDLSVESDPPLPLELYPRQILRSGEKGKVVFNGHAVPSEFTVTIRYQTRLGIREAKRIKVYRGTPQEITG